GERVRHHANERRNPDPKTLLEQCRLDEAVELAARGDQPVVRSATKARSGWEETFREMARPGDDALSDQEAAPPSRTLRSPSVSCNCDMRPGTWRPLLPPPSYRGFVDRTTR